MFGCSNVAGSIWPSNLPLERSKTVTVVMEPMWSSFASRRKPS